MISGLGQQSEHHVGRSTLHIDMGLCLEDRRRRDGKRLVGPAEGKSLLPKRWVKSTGSLAQHQQTRVQGWKEGTTSGELELFTYHEEALGSKLMARPFVSDPDAFKRYGRVGTEKWGSLGSQDYGQEGKGSFGPCFWFALQ